MDGEQYAVDAGDRWGAAGRRIRDQCYRFSFRQMDQPLCAWMMVLLALTFCVLLVWHPAATVAHPHVNPQAPFSFALPMFTLLALNLYTKVAFNAYSGLGAGGCLCGRDARSGAVDCAFGMDCGAGDRGDLCADDGSMLTYVPSGQIDLAGAIPQTLAAAFGGSGTGVWVGRAMIPGAGGVHDLLVCADYGGDEPAAAGGGLG